MRIDKVLVTAALLIFPLVLAAGEPGRLAYADREDVKAFVRELAAEASFNENELLSIFRHAEYKQNIIDAISRPAEKTLTWAEYQDIFLTQRRRSAGIDFMHRNEAAFVKLTKFMVYPR